MAACSPANPRKCCRWRSGIFCFDRFKVMLERIKTTVAIPDLTLLEIALRIDRFTLAKRLWRGCADDGKEFGFDLESPLKPGETIFQTQDARYVVRQAEEPVVAISLDVAPSAAAGIGWAIGNLHLELS